MKIFLAITILFAVVPVRPAGAADNKPNTAAILDGLEGVYLGMTMSELLITRPQLESGTDWMDIFDGRGRLFSDLNNPRKIDIKAIKNIEAKWPDAHWPTDYHFDEKTSFPLLETIYYRFYQPWLRQVSIGGSINSGKKLRAYPQNRDKLLELVIQSWGKPDKVYLGEHLGEVRQHEYYTVNLEWKKDDVLRSMSFPVALDDYVKRISLPQKLWLKILGQGYGGVGLFVGLPFGFSQSWPEKDFSPFHDFYKPVGPEDTERLLKSIKYYEIAERALKARERKPTGSHQEKQGK